MEKYIGLINPSKLKLEFLFDFISIFSPAKNISSIWELIHSREYNDFVRLSSYLDRDKITIGDRTSEQSRYEEGLKKYKTANKNELLKVSYTQYSLIDKIDSMLDKGNSLGDVLIMLNSFLRPKGLNGVRGTKRLRSNVRGTDDYHEWTEKDGNEKLSHKGNLPKAHFRWNYGERYILTDEELNKIQKFISPYLRLLNY